jgi:hypothetical protein
MQEGYQAVNPVFLPAFHRLGWSANAIDMLIAGKRKEIHFANGHLYGKALE